VRCYSEILAERSRVVLDDNAAQRFLDALDHPERFARPPALARGPAFGPVGVTHGAIRVEPLNRTRLEPVRPAMPSCDRRDCGTLATRFSIWTPGTPSCARGSTLLDRLPEHNRVVSGDGGSPDLGEPSSEEAAGWHEWLAKPTPAPYSSSSRSLRSAR
jgi:hypothetical protein